MISLFLLTKQTHRSPPATPHHVPTLPIMRDKKEPALAGVEGTQMDQMDQMDFLLSISMSEFRPPFTTSAWSEGQTRCPQREGRTSGRVLFDVTNYQFGGRMCTTVKEADKFVTILENSQTNEKNTGCLFFLHNM